VEVFQEVTFRVQRHPSHLLIYVYYVSIKMIFVC